MMEGLAIRVNQREGLIVMSGAFVGFKWSGWLRLMVGVRLEQGVIDVRELRKLVIIRALVSGVCPVVERLAFLWVFWPNTIIDPCYRDSLNRSLVWVTCQHDGFGVKTDKIGDSATGQQERLQQGL